MTICLYSSGKIGVNVTFDLMKKMILRIVVLSLFFPLCLLAQPNSDVMLQGFNWDSHSNPVGWYNAMWPNTEAIAQAGIDLVWMPPPSDAADPQGYLPRRLYNVNSSYGSQGQLVALINNLRNKGIDVVADIVINHRVGAFGFADFQNPAWGCWAVVSNDGWNGACGNPDTGDLYGPARDIDHTNTQVQQDIIDWLNWLKNDIGFSGWRYDYVRGFAPSYISMYNNATNPSFSMAELWPDFDINNTDANRQTIVNWIDATGGASKAIDFTTKGILQVAVQNQYWRLSQNGNVPGLIGWWPSRAVTFIDNHDTGSSQNYWPFPGNKVMEGYCYILTHPGTPTVFWDHLFDWGLYDQIKDLVWIRKRNGLTDESSVNIIQATNNVYAAILDDKVAMKIGPGSWSPPGNGWNLKASGSNYAVWDRLPAQPAGFTVYLKAPNNATGQPRIHYWNVQPGGSSSTWPGVAPTLVCDRWFSYTFANAQSANFLFHNNQGLQTPDLFAWKDSWYVNGAWANDEPDFCGNNGCGNGLTWNIRFPASWTSPHIYLWNSVPQTDETAWPGFPMQPTGNVWYTYTAACANCTNFIVSNNGANQTADLQTCTNITFNGTGSANLMVLEDAASAMGIGAMQLSPNPATDLLQVHLESGQPRDLIIEIYDLAGKQVSAAQRESLPEGRSVLIYDVQSLAQGMYLLRVQSDGEVQTQKFFKK